MTFRDDFLRLIEPTTIYRLSKATGIERTKLQRIKSGQKLPTKDELEIISRELSLTPDEKDTLFRELEIAVIGEDKFKSRLRTKDFIEQLYTIFYKKTAKAIKTSEISLNIKCPYTTNSISDTNNLINSFINAEASKKNHIYIYNSIATGDVFNNIFSGIIDNPDLSVTHIIGLTPHNDNFESYYTNIDLISRIYPVFLSKTNYYVYYYYNKVMENSMFPYTIISDNYTLMLSYNLKHAVLTDNKYITDSYKSVFNEKLNGSYPLISDIANLDEYTKIYIDHISSLVKGVEELNLLEYDPCIFPYIDSDIIQRLIKKELPNYDLIVSRCLSVKECYKGLNKTVSYFSKEGLQNFIRNGRITEIPEIAYEPIPFKIRLELLERLCYDAKNNDAKEIYLINETKLKMPENLRYCGNGQVNDFLLLLSKKNEKPSIFKLNEFGFAKPFNDFVSHLKDTDMVLSNRETVEYIEKCITEHKTTI